MCRSRSTESAPAEITPAPPAPRRLFLPREHIFPQMFIELKLHPADGHRASPRCLCVCACVCQRSQSTSKQRGSDGPRLMCEHWGFVSARSVAHHRVPTHHRLIAAAVTAGNISLFVRTRPASLVRPLLCFVSFCPLVASSKHINKKQRRRQL